MKSFNHLIETGKKKTQNTAGSRKHQATFQVLQGNTKTLKWDPTKSWEQLKKLQRQTSTPEIVFLHRTLKKTSDGLI